MRARLLGVVSVIAVLLLWEFVGRFIVKEKIFLVPFSEVMVYLVRWAVAGDLGRNIAASAQAFGIGFALAIVIGVSLGIAIGLNATIRGLADPLVAALYSTPLLALTPLFILWLGIGLASKVAIIMLVSVFPIIINTTAGVREVETQYLDVARSFGARPRLEYKGAAAHGGALYPRGDSHQRGARGGRRLRGGAARRHGGHRLCDLEFRVGV